MCATPLDGAAPAHPSASRARSRRGPRATTWSDLLARFRRPAGRVEHDEQGRGRPGRVEQARTRPRRGRVKPLHHGGGA
jgi:hypothetical protein